MNVLQTWYNISEKKYRLLNEWQSIRLAEQVRPNEAEVSVFRGFVTRMISIQKHLNNSYHGDRFLRDRLLTAVYIPSIKDLVKDKYLGHSSN